MKLPSDSPMQRANDWLEGAELPEERRVDLAPTLAKLLEQVRNEGREQVLAMVAMLSRKRGTT